MATVGADFVQGSDLLKDCCFRATEKAAADIGGLAREAFEQHFRSSAGLDVKQVAVPPPANTKNGARYSEPDLGRRNELLPRIAPEKIRVASALAATLKAEWQEAGKLYQQHKLKHASTLGQQHNLPERLVQRVIEAKRGEERGIRLGKRVSSYQRVVNSIQSIAHLLEQPELAANTEVLTLTAFLCARTPANPFGFLSKIPDGLVHPDAPGFRERAGILLRYHMTEVVKLRSAYDLERFDGMQTLFRHSGLNSLARHLSPIGVLATAFPGIFNGFDPPVRPWLLQLDRKWQGKRGRSLAEWACGWVLQIGESVYDPRSGDFDLKRIREMRWNETFTAHGLKKMLECCKATPTAAAALNLGALALEGRKIIGLSPLQVPPWQIGGHNKWRRKTGKRLIDQVTKYLIEYDDSFFNRHREIYSPKGGRELDPEQVKKFGGWTLEFERVANGCLRSSGISAGRALERVYSRLFGWAPWQIKPWEMRRTGMWSGRKGQELFRQAFAYALFQAGLGGGSYDRKIFTLTLDQQHLSACLSEKRGKSVSLRDLMRKAELTGGVRSVARDNFVEAVRILFGLPEQAMPALRGRPNLQPLNLLLDVVKNNGGTVTLSFKRRGVPERPRQRIQPPRGDRGRTSRATTGSAIGQQALHERFGEQLPAVLESRLPDILRLCARTYVRTGSRTEVLRRMNGAIDNAYAEKAVEEALAAACLPVSPLQPRERKQLLYCALGALRRATITVDQNEPIEVRENKLHELARAAVGKGFEELTMMGQ